MTIIISDKNEDTAVMLHEIADVCIAPMRELKAQDFFIRNAFSKINDLNQIKPGIIFNTTFWGFSNYKFNQSKSDKKYSEAINSKSIEIILANGEKIDPKKTHISCKSLTDCSGLLDELHLKISLRHEYISKFIPEYIILELTDYIWDQFLAEKYVRKAKKPSESLWCSEQYKSESNIIEFLKKCKINQITLGQQAVRIFKQLKEERQFPLRYLNEILCNQYNRSKWNNLLNIANNKIINLNDFMKLYIDIEEDVISKISLNRTFESNCNFKLFETEISLLKTISEEIYLDKILLNICMHEKQLDSQPTRLLNGTSRFASLAKTYENYKSEAGIFFIENLEERSRFLSKNINHSEMFTACWGMNDEINLRLSKSGFCREVIFLKLKQALPTPDSIKKLMLSRENREIVPAIKAKIERSKSGKKGADEVKLQKNIQGRINEIKKILEDMYNNEINKRQNTPHLPKPTIEDLRKKAAKKECDNLKKKEIDAEKKEKLKPLSKSTMIAHGITKGNLKFWK